MTRLIVAILLGFVTTASACPGDPGPANSWVYTNAAIPYKPWVNQAGVASGAALCVFESSLNMTCVAGAAVGRNRTWHSTDAGHTFQWFHDSDQLSLNYSPQSMIRIVSAVGTPTMLIAADSQGIPNPGDPLGTGIFWLTPDGITFTTPSVQLGTIQGAGIPHGLAQGRSGRILAMGPNEGPLFGVESFVCDDGITHGLTWSCSRRAGLLGSDGYPAEFVQNQVFANPRGTIWLATGRTISTSVANIWRSTDDGVTWTNVLTETVDSQGAAIACSSARLCFATGSRNWRSTDGGITWVRLTTAGGAHPGIAVFDELKVTLVGSDFDNSPTLHRTNDGGLTWTVLKFDPDQACPDNTSIFGSLLTVAVHDQRALIVMGHNASINGSCAQHTGVNP